MITYHALSIPTALRPRRVFPLILLSQLGAGCVSGAGESTAHRELPDAAGLDETTESSDERANEAGAIDASNGETHHSTDGGVVTLDGADEDSSGEPTAEAGTGLGDAGTGAEEAGVEVVHPTVAQFLEPEPLWEPNAQHLLEKASLQVLPLPPVVEIPRYEQVVQDAVGGYYVITKIDESNGQRVVRFDSRWQQQWSVGPLKDDAGAVLTASAIVGTPDGGVVVLADRVFEPNPYETAETHAFKFDATGAALWADSYYQEDGFNFCGGVGALGVQADGTVHVVNRAMRMYKLDLDGNRSGVVSSSCSDSRFVAIDADGNSYVTAPTIEHEAYLYKDAPDGTGLGLPGLVVESAEGYPVSAIYLVSPAQPWVERSTNAVFLSGAQSLARLDSDGTPLWVRDRMTELKVRGVPGASFSSTFGMGGGGIASLFADARGVLVAGTVDWGFEDRGSSRNVHVDGRFVASFTLDGEAEWFRLYALGDERMSDDYSSESVFRAQDGRVTLSWSTSNGGRVMQLDAHGLSPHLFPADSSLHEPVAKTWAPEGHAPDASWDANHIPFGGDMYEGGYLKSTPVGMLYSLNAVDPFGEFSSITILSGDAAGTSWTLGNPFDPEKYERFSITDVASDHEHIHVIGNYQEEQQNQATLAVYDTQGVLVSKTSVQHTGPLALGRDGVVFLADSSRLIVQRAGSPSAYGFPLSSPVRGLESDGEDGVVVLVGGLAVQGFDSEGGTRWTTPLVSLVDEPDCHRSELNRDGSFTTVTLQCKEGNWRLFRLNSAGQIDRKFTLSAPAVQAVTATSDALYLAGLVHAEASFVSRLDWSGAEQWQVSLTNRSVEPFEATLPGFDTEPVMFTPYTTITQLAVGADANLYVNAFYTENLTQYGELGTAMVATFDVLTGNLVSRSAEP